MIELITDLLDRLLAVLSALDPLLLALAAAVFTALETTALIGLVVPGDAVVLLAASTVRSPDRFALIVAAAAFGSYAGELIGYTIGRAVGPGLRTSRFGRLLGEERWARAEVYLAGRGAPVLVPVRFISVLHAVAPVVAGTVRMPLRRFTLWAAVGAVSWATVYTAIGAAASTAYREHGHIGLLPTVVVIAGSAVVLLVRRLLRRRRRRLRRPTPPTPDSADLAVVHGKNRDGNE